MLANGGPTRQRRLAEFSPSSPPLRESHNKQQVARFFSPWSPLRNPSRSLLKSSTPSATLPDRPSAQNCSPATHQCASAANPPALANQRREPRSCSAKPPTRDRLRKEVFLGDQQCAAGLNFPRTKSRHKRCRCSRARKVALRGSGRQVAWDSRRVRSNRISCPNSTLILRTQVVKALRQRAKKSSNRRRNHDCPDLPQPLKSLRKSR